MDYGCLSLWLCFWGNARIVFHNAWTETMVDVILCFVDSTEEKYFD